jgi:hypothetical protein
MTNPKTGNQEEVRTAFLADLQAVLDKWDAEIEIIDSRSRGHEMEVCINAIYTPEGGTLRELTYIDLGRRIQGIKND